MWYLGTPDYTPPWLEAQPTLKQMFQTGNQELSILAGVCLLGFAASPGLWGAEKQGREQAVLPPTPISTWCLSMCECAKKCSKTPQTPTVLPLENSQQVFSRRRKGNDSPGFSGGHSHGHWSWGPGWECFLILSLEQAVICYQLYPQSL